jgi:hypothetical protein
MDPRTEKMLTERAQKGAPARAVGDVSAWMKAHGLVMKIGAAVTVIILIAAHYILVAKPAERSLQLQIDARAAERIKTATAARQVAMDDCLSKAKEEADARWNAACKARGERGGCALAARQTEDLQQKEGQARNSCLMKFSVAAQ